jgi:hypothetical protein
MKRADAVGGVIVAVLLATPVVALQEGRTENQKRRACASNLRTLWQSCFNYAAQYGRPNGLMPLDTGTNFWLRLKRTPKPLLEKTDAFFCPLAGHDESVDQTSYRGPAANVNKMDDLDPVGADFDGNHGEKKGGNVLQKTGDINHYAAEEPMWDTADSKLTGKGPVKPQDPKTPSLEKRIEALEKAVKELTELVKQLKEQLDKPAM